MLGGGGHSELPSCFLSDLLLEKKIVLAFRLSDIDSVGHARPTMLSIPLV